MASSVVCVSGDVTSLSGSLLELIEKDANNSVPGFRSLTISHQIFPSVIKKKKQEINNDIQQKIQSRVIPPFASSKESINRTSYRYFKSCSPTYHI